MMNNMDVKSIVEFCYDRTEACAELSLHMWPQLDPNLRAYTVGEALMWIKNWGSVTTARVLATMEIDQKTMFMDLTPEERERLALFLTETKFRRYAR